MILSVAQMDAVIFYTHGSTVQNRFPARDYKHLQTMLPWPTQVVFEEPFVFLIQQNGQRLNLALKRLDLAQTIHGHVVCVHNDGEEFTADDVVACVESIEFYSDTTGQCHPSEMLLSHFPMTRLPLKYPKEARYRQ